MIPPFPSALVANKDEDMRKAFDLFAGSDGAIDTDEMKTVVPLIGEEMTAEQVRCLFVVADKVLPPSTKTPLVIHFSLIEERSPGCFYL